MSFVGIISEKDDYEFIENELSKDNKYSNIQLININNTNIDNMKNIKFETIIINNNINNMKSKKEMLNKILKNCKYLLINSDINARFNVAGSNKIEIITYGMNQKATVTASSIKEEEVLICIQRNIENLKSNIIELQEIKKRMERTTSNKVYNLLAYTVLEEIYK